MAQKQGTTLVVHTCSDYRDAVCAGKPSRYVIVTYRSTQPSIPPG